TLNPAPSIAPRASDSDLPVTSGTATFAGPDDTTSVIAEPTGTGCPADGLVSMMFPAGIVSLVSDTVRPTLSPAFVIVRRACAWESPTTEGTFTDVGPEETVRETVEPSSTLAPPTGISPITVWEGWVLGCWVTLIWKPSFWRIVRAVASG